MKKFILGLAVVLALTGSAKAVLIGQFTFTGNTTATDVASGVTFSAVTASGVSATTSSTDYVTGDGNGSGPRWSSRNYIQFIISPVTGNQMNVASVTFNMTGSADSSFSAASVQFDYGTGFSTASPNTFSVGTSPTTQAVTFNMPTVVAPVTVRFFGGSGGNNDTITFDNISVDGEVSPITVVPEPINVALALFGCTFAGIGFGRKFLKKKM